MDMSLLQKPAKDLTDAEAFEVLMYLYDSAEIKLPDGVKRDPKNPDKILSPKPGEQLKVGTTLGDVTFRQANDAKRPPKGPEGSDALAYFTPTPAFAVLLYRLGVLLHEKWNVTTIICGGVGSGTKPTDCHSKGRCVDFYGVIRDGGGTIDVQRDWTHRPVYLAWIDEDGTREKYDAVGDDNWGGDTHTFFRLVYSDEPQDLTPRQFFSSVYEFAMRECTTGPSDISADNFRRGVLLGNGFIFHPDYPYWGGSYANPGRYSHHDHMHFQIGPT